MLTHTMKNVRQFGVRCAALEVITGLLRAYMLIRIGERPHMHRGFSHAQNDRINATCPRAVQAFEAVQDRVFA